MVFGVRETDLAKSAAHIAYALGVRFLAHESSFRGGLYYLAKVEGACFRVQRNADLIDDPEPLEPDWPRSGTILQIEGYGNFDPTDWTHKLATMEARGFVERLPPRTPGPALAEASEGGQ